MHIVHFLGTNTPCGVALHNAWFRAEFSRAEPNTQSNYLVQSFEFERSEVLKEYLGAMARFNTYSFGTAMLIAQPKPDATNDGIRAWKSLGRFVKRGEKGILILAPMIGFRRSRQDKIATEDAEVP
jgi:hypothetical protein